MLLKRTGDVVRDFRGNFIAGFLRAGNDADLAASLNRKRLFNAFEVPRDGFQFRRWASPVIPSTAPKDRAGNRSNYMANGILQLPGKTGEYSVYATEAYYTGPDSRIRRFTYRKDGFVSIRAGSAGGHVVTNPLRHSGGKLVLNFKTKNTGSIRVELRDAGGVPIKGFSAADCKPLTGDSLQHAVSWRGGSLPTGNVKAIRVRFLLKDAALFSMRFAK